MNSLESDADREERARAYRAIGRYTVQFSVLIASVRKLWARHVAAGNTAKHQLVELAFGDIGAKPIAEAFFAMCKTVGEFDEAEAAIWSKTSQARSGSLGPHV